jgi:hypothetical protein
VQDYVFVEQNMCYTVLIPLLSLFQVRHLSVYFSLTKVAVSVHVYHYVVDVAALLNSRVLTFHQILHCLWRGYQKL